MGEKKHYNKHSISFKAKDVKKNLRQEIDILKSKVRTAYTLEVQVNVSEYQPTPEELELIQERPFNLKMLEKLESMYYLNPKKQRSVSTHLYNENLTLLHFFYLVRLAQQGFFYLISGAYPDVEPEALIYLCDKLVGASIYAERTAQEIEKKAFRSTAYRLMRNLVARENIPVAQGFKTTYKQIMDIIQDLIYQSLGPNPSKEEEKKDDVAGEEEIDTSKKQIPANIPPLWVVMPHIGMMDNKTFAMPGTVPSLPFPSHILAALTVPQATYPNAVEDLKSEVIALEQKFQNKRKERMSKKEDESKEENVTQNGEEEEEEYDSEYERVRFADAETSESEEEVEEEVVVQKEPEVIKAKIEAAVVQQEEVTQKEPVVHHKEPTKNEGQFADSSPKMNRTSKIVETEGTDQGISKWLNFAASSPTKENKKAK